MNINTKMYSDGFYKLSTKVCGNIISITYSDRTPFDEAIKDFKDHVRNYKHTHYGSDNGSVAVPDTE